MLKCDLNHRFSSNCCFVLETRIPKPLLDAADCANDTHIGCSDGTCVPAEYFCDGSIDCQDASDEVFSNTSEEFASTKTRFKLALFLYLAAAATLNSRTYLFLIYEFPI